MKTNHQYLKEPSQTLITQEVEAWHELKVFDLQRKIEYLYEILPNSEKSDAILIEENISELKSDIEMHKKAKDIMECYL